MLVDPPRMLLLVPDDSCNIDRCVFSVNDLKFIQHFICDEGTSATFVKEGISLDHVVWVAIVPQLNLDDAHADHGTLHV